MLAREGANIMLDEIKNSSGKYSSWISAPLEPPLGRGVNLQIKTNNVDALYHHAREMGANIFLPIETKWYRVNNVEVEQRQFIVMDPDGYMLRFAELFRAPV